MKQPSSQAEWVLGFSVFLVLGCGGGETSVGSQESDTAATTGTATAGTDSEESTFGTGEPTVDTNGEESTLGTEGEQTSTTSETDDNPQQEVEEVIACDPTCNELGPFYWEIGNADGPILSGSTGDGSVGPGTTMAIASATKWVFGAYVVERFQDDVGQIDIDAMTMRSGYTNLENLTCALQLTVEGCFSATHNGGANSDYEPATDGVFYYNGGHFQAYGVELGLGPMTRPDLDSEFKSLLGDSFATLFVGGSPQLAGGMKSNAADYAAFLRQILRGDLAIADHLGNNGVCTECEESSYSPAFGYAWHYSYGHWVEDDPTSQPPGDGAFSSAGKFGFYPWVDASQTYYGLIARYSTAPLASLESARCGAKVREAFFHPGVSACE